MQHILILYIDPLSGYPAAADVVHLQYLRCIGIIQFLNPAFLQEVYESLFFLGRGLLERQSSDTPRADRRLFFKDRPAFFLLDSIEIAAAGVPATVSVELRVFSLVVDLHSLTHHVNVLLCVFNHLHCLLPFLLECLFSFEYLFFLYLHPLLQLLLPLDVGPW